MEKFRKLGISEEVLKTLKSMLIETPTEIQEKAIPFALEGKDIIGGSATGSGKTLAFASAIIEKIKPEKKVKAIILTPTRELAEQVAQSIKSFSKDNLKITSIYGGINMDTQTRKMHNSDVIVGTPGRILDHLNRRTLSLRNVEFLVLDEFDRMLDMGFQRDVDKIIRECPKNRQTMLFSATLSVDVEYLAHKYTKKPVEISVKPHVDPKKLKQIYYDVQDGLKFSLLVHLLKQEKSHLVMVFCSTRRNADFVTTNLNKLGIVAKAIHGGLEQKKRMKVLKEFHKPTGTNILVCTDVAARGLDIKGISHVYNYDLPKITTDYIHRIGRTARAGEEGIAINILASRDYENFSNLQNRENVTIEEIETPYVKKVDIVRDSGRKSNRRDDSRRRDSGRGRDNSRERGNIRDSRRERDTRRGRDSRGGRKEMFDAVCMKCKKKCQVPFKPTNGKGVSCSNCFVKKDSPQRGNDRRNNNRMNDDRRRDSRRGRDSRSEGRSNDRRSNIKRGPKSRSNDSRNKFNKRR